MSAFAHGLYNGLPFVDLDEKIVAVFSPYAYLLALINRATLDRPEIQRHLKQFGFYGVPSPEGPLPKDHLDITLIVTTDCNLRCRYCFTEAGSRPVQMNEHIALEILSRLPGAKAKSSVSVTFFGGEPTLSMNTIKKVVEQVAFGRLFPGKKVTYGISTHGVISVDDVEFLSENNFDVMISADGLPDIQNYQRPTSGNGRTAHIVEQTIKTLHRSANGFKVRSTVTNQSVSQLSEATSYYASLGVPLLHFEPMTYAGRAGRGDEITNAELRKPDEGVYLLNFSKALSTALASGIRLTSSYFTNFLKPSSVYCDAHTTNRFVITPSGELTRCLEIQDSCHDLASHGIEKLGSDRSGLMAVLRDFQSFDLRKSCTSCVAKYTCGGGCPVRNLRGTGSISTVDHHECYLHEHIFRLALNEILKASNNPDNQIFRAPDIRVHRMSIPKNLWMKGMDHVAHHNQLSLTIPSIFY